MDEISQDYHQTLPATAQGWKPTVQYLPSTKLQIDKVSGTYQYPWWQLFPVHDGECIPQFTCLLSSSLVCSKGLVSRDPFQEMPECWAPMSQLVTGLYLPSCSLSQVLDSFRPSGSCPRGASTPQQQPERETRAQHRHQRGHPALIPCRLSLVHPFIITPFSCHGVASMQVQSERGQFVLHYSSTAVYNCITWVPTVWQKTCPDMSSVMFWSSCYRHC